MPSLIYGAYGLVNDEPDDYSSSFEIIESEAGVFMNENREHNGKVFLRYYFEEKGECKLKEVYLILIHKKKTVKVI